MTIVILEKDKTDTFCENELNKMQSITCKQEIAKESNKLYIIPYCKITHKIQAKSREQDEEEEIKKVLSNAYISSDKDFILKSIDAVALYGKIAITHLLNFNNTINDIELKNYIVTKIREIKSENPQ